MKDKTSHIKGRGAHINPPNKFNKLNDDGVLVDEFYDPDNPLLKTKVIETQAKSIVNPVKSADVPLEYSLNPYQGCAHGCVYCYARNTHNYWGYSAGLEFETRLIAKTNAAALLEKKLKSKNWKASPIMISGNTDCYQPIEKKYQLTRQLLEVCLKYKHPVGLVTKNRLILRDLDLLTALNKDKLVSVAISINTLDDTLRQKLEPRASSISTRLDTIKQLTDNGISVTALAAPLIPGLNDHEILPLVKKLYELGVRGVGHIMVRLNGDIATIFEDWLKRNFPNKMDKVLNQIRSLHKGELGNTISGNRMRGHGNIADIIHKQFKLANEKYGTGLGKFEYNRTLYHQYKDPQLRLF